MYTFHKTGSTYALSIDNHQNLTEAVMAFIRDEHITAGEISGIGAVSEATLRFFNPQTKLFEDRTFSQQMEIANLIGNISVMDGKPYLHLHITLGTADFQTISGHLLTARISGACELFVHSFDTTLLREREQSTGLNLYKF